jgi:hypothetical protein
MNLQPNVAEQTCPQSSTESIVSIVSTQVVPLGQKGKATVTYQISSGVEKILAGNGKTKNTIC